MFKPDPTWQLFTYGKSFEDFAKAHPAFELRPEVPSAIREHLEDVHALVLHSYYRYRFLDVAHARAMQIVEMALYTRHREFSSPELPSDRRKKKPRVPPLNELLNWAEETGLVEDTIDRPSWGKFDQKPIETLRNIRNYAIHTEPESILGVSAVGLLYRMVDFVNELYEAVEVRKQRHELERSIQQELNRLTANGAILDVGGTRLIVFYAEILFAERVANDWKLYLGFLKIFPPAPDENGGHDLPDPIYICASEYTTVNDSIRFRLNDDSYVQVRTITDEQNTKKYKTFLDEYNRYPLLKPAIFIPLANQRIRLKRYRSHPDNQESATKDHVSP